MNDFVWNKSVCALQGDAQKAEANLSVWHYLFGVLSAVQKE